ncbi:hypothetical protein DL93DRAFT_2171688 [Clavulina sp. PMI_390]|nr:hypothetical protein DL93DRAFT_2171688 [Clavulina sp. PMI_390]
MESGEMSDSFSALALDSHPQSESQSPGPALQASSRAIPVLKYLGLPLDSIPSPETHPIEFLNLYLTALPSDPVHPALSLFITPSSSSRDYDDEKESKDVPMGLTPRQRTGVKRIKNRRTQYALGTTNVRDGAMGMMGGVVPPKILGWERGRMIEPRIWDAMNGGGGGGIARALQPPPKPPRLGEQAGEDERAWVEQSFMGYANANSGAAGSTSAGPGNQTQGPNPKRGYVGRLGDLLAEYEEEREAERVRAERIERAAMAATLAARERETEEEFDSESDEEEEEEEEEDEGQDGEDASESPEEVRAAFERVLRERFIDGLLPAELYEDVDFNDKYDVDDRDDEDRWFDDEEEGP